MVSDGLVLGNRVKSHLNRPFLSHSPPYRRTCGALGSVTEHGGGLRPVIEEMVDWSEDYLGDADSPDESVV